LRVAAHAPPPSARAYREIVDATPRPQRLADAVAPSAAAVYSPAAGSFDLDAYRRHRGEVVTQVLPETADRPGATSA